MAKRAHLPKPNVGDMAKLRGRDPVGRIVQQDYNGWCLMDWTPDMPVGPKIVHIDELERLT